MNIATFRQTKKCKHGHDQVKGKKLTFFCVDELVSNLELLCSVDFCHFNAMLKAENIKGLSNPSLLNMDVKNDFDKAS